MFLNSNYKNLKTNLIHMKLLKHTHKTQTNNIFKTFLSRSYSKTKNKLKILKIEIRIDIKILHCDIGQQIIKSSFIYFATCKLHVLIYDVVMLRNEGRIFFPLK